MSITRIHHLGLTVTDAYASARWYSAVLGFVPVGEFTSPDGARRKVFLSHDTLPVRLGLCQHTANTGAHFNEARTGLDHLAFAVQHVGELRDWEARLLAHNVRYTTAAPANTLEGALVLVFRDPDNIQLELIAEGDPLTT